ncbi:MAG: hypothetical protein AAGN82_31990 [Myxococcota bacterium]
MMPHRVVATMMLLLGGGGACSTPATVTDVQLAATLEPISFSQGVRWSPRGRFSLTMTTADDGEANEVILTAAGLAVCGAGLSERFGVSNRSAGDLSISTDKELPLTLPPGETVTADFSFVGDEREIDAGDRGWSGWCSSLTQNCPHFESQFEVSLADRSSRPEAYENNAWRIVQPLSLEFDGETGLGAPPPQTFGAAWSQSSPTALPVDVSAYGVGASGRIAVAGYVEGRDVLTMVDADGTIAWVVPFTGSFKHVFFTAEDTRLVAIGDRFMESASGYSENIVVETFAGDDGQPEREDVYEHPGDQEVIGARIAPDGGAIAIVESDVGVDWEGQGNFIRDRALVRWDPTGAVRFARPLPGPDALGWPRLAVEGSGRILVIAPWRGPADFGAGLVPAPPATTAAVVAAAYDEGTGALLYVNQVGENAETVRVTTDREGRVHVFAAGEVGHGRLRGTTGHLGDAGTVHGLHHIDLEYGGSRSGWGFAVDGSGHPVFAVGDGIAAWSDGAMRWRQIACEGEFQLGMGVTGDIAVIGWFRGYVSLDQGPFTSPQPEQYDQAAVVALIPAKDE